MRKKENNNLIMVDYGKGKREYYTSYTRIGMKLGLAAQSVKWASLHNNVITTCNNENITISIVDGSEIPYKYINNN